MTLENFLIFVDKTIGELILYGQMHSGKDYTDYELEFSWSLYGQSIASGRQNIISEIVDKVFVSPEQIYPCVDLVLEQPTPEKKIKNRGT